MEILKKSGRLSDIVNPLYDRILTERGDFVTLKSLAEVSMNMERFHEGARLYRAALELSPRAEPGMYMAYAAALRKTGAYGDALSAYTVAARLMPLHASQIAYDMIGVLIESGDYRRALERISRLSGDGGARDIEKFYLSILCYYHLGDYKNALVESGKAVEFFKSRKNLSPSNQFYYLFGMAADKADDMGFIERHLEPRLSLPEADSELFNFVGYTYADHNYALERARKYIVKALSEEPESYAIIDSMAWLLYREGSFAEAEKYILKAMNGAEKAGKLDSVLCDHAGDIFFASGKLSEARACWLRALDLSGEADYSSIRVKLEKLLIRNE